MSDEMPKIKIESLAQDIACSFPEFFDPEGEDYSSLHKLLRIEKTVKREVNQAVRDALDEAIVKINLQLSDIDDPKDEQEQLVNSGAESSYEDALLLLNNLKSKYKED